MMKRFIKLFLFLLISGNLCSQSNSEAQPYVFKTKRLLETLENIGNPISALDKANIENIIAQTDEQTTIQSIQSILDKYALFFVTINPESRVSVKEGLAKPILQQSGWTTFLIRIDKQAGINGIFNVFSEQAKRNL